MATTRDRAALKQTIESLPSGWDVFMSAVFGGIVQADHWDDDQDGDRQIDEQRDDDAGLAMAEREAERATELLMEAEEEQDGLGPVSPHDAERLIRVATFEAWRQVRTRQLSRDASWRSVGEIADAVAKACAIELPAAGDINAAQYRDAVLAELDRNRPNAIPMA